MERSIAPTPYILVRAQTNSDWDKCSFALVHIEQPWIEKMTEWMKSIEPFASDISLADHVYCDRPEGFFADTDANDLDENENWIYVNLTQTELEGFELPENALDTHQFCISPDFAGRYRAFGKHTGEEFWTDRFAVDQIVGDYHRNRIPITPITKS